MLEIPIDLAIQDLNRRPGFGRWHWPYEEQRDDVLFFLLNLIVPKAPDFPGGGMHWLWCGDTTRTGAYPGYLYGVIRLHPFTARGRVMPIKTTRAAYELFIGPSTNLGQLRQLCHQTCCVNPHHYYSPAR